MTFAGALAVSLAAFDAPEASAPVADGRITLSMSVEPGEPVPVELITEEAAGELYDDGYFGQGVDVALIDSGVAPVVGLDQPGKIVNGPDLSNEGGQDNLAHLDTYGHGTHLAGIIAGDDGKGVKGVAPQSRIVNVKVAGVTGETAIAQVIAGIDWVIEHKNDNGLDIRVLNLSLGVDGVKTNQGDPLSAAVERAWDAGIVVVAAVGNRGNGSPGVDSPAISPYVIGVGGTESYESSGEKDRVATWSSSGNRHRQPDVVAPGRSILSFRVPGSMLDTLHPTARVEDRYFRGSGTSQSAAVVSGYAALLLSADPTLTPDQVKFLLELFADDIHGGTNLDGHGRVDLEETSENLHYKAKAPVQNHPRALPSLCLASDLPILTTPGPIVATPFELAPSDAVLTPAMPIADNEVSLSSNKNDVATFDAMPLTGDAPVRGNWKKAPTVLTPCGPTWSGGTWNGATWSGGVWSGATWSGATWSGATWSGGVWSGATWSGATWSGATWSGATWSGATWSGATWSGATWSGATWSGKFWNGGS